MDTGLLEYTIICDHKSSHVVEGRKKPSMLRFTIGGVQIYIHKKPGVRFDYRRVSMAAQTLTEALGRSQRDLSDIIAQRPRKSKAHREDNRQMVLPGLEELE